MSDKDKRIREYLEGKITEYDKILEYFNKEHLIEELALRNVFNPHILSNAAEAEFVTHVEEAKADILAQVYNKIPQARKLREKEKKRKRKQLVLML